MTHAYPTYQQPPPARTPSKRTSIVPVVLGALLLVASVAVGLLLLTRFATISRADRVEDFARFVVDGGARGDVDVKTTGLYTIYYEFEGAVDDDGDVQTIDAAPDPPDDLEIAVRDDREDDVGVRTMRQQFEFATAGRRGVPVGQVELEEEGQYTIEATGGDEPFVISMGRGVLTDDLTDDDVKRIGLGILVIGGLAGLGLLLWGLGRNSRARRRSRGGGPPPGGFQTPPYPGYLGQGWQQPSPHPPQAPPGWGTPSPPGHYQPPFPGPS